MDHISSSSSSTGTTTYTRQSVSTFQQDVPKQTYTTAGTIYNPSNSQPLQPPVRRGRTLKWPPVGTAASELSLFPKSVLAGLPLKSQNHIATPTSPLPHQIPKYSPLQQNYDRAVSPVTDHNRESPNDSDISSLNSSRIPSYTMNGNQVSPVDGVMPASSVNKHVDAESSDDEDDESTSENPLKNFTVKGLQNLASYPNPNQKRAQKTLLRARPGATPAPSTGNLSRTATPSYGVQAFDVSDLAKNGSNSPGLFHSAKTDPNAILKLQVDQRPVGELNASWRANSATPPPPPGLFPAHNIQRSLPHSAYKSTLATGPGAPRPLTAGPPGQRQRQRQCRTSTFDSAIKELNGGSKTDVSYDGSVNNDILPVPKATHNNTSLDALRLVGSETPDHLKAGLPSLLCNSTPDADHLYQAPIDSGKLSDVEMMKILQYMNLGPNANVHDYKNRSRQPEVGIPVIFGEKWVAEYPQSDRSRLAQGTWMIAQDELQRRTERVNQLFYAGTGELGKSLESVVKDAEFNNFKRQVGVIGDRRPKAKLEKVEYPPISIQQANNMTNKEAAEPLVALGISSVLNHIEGKRDSQRFYQWKDLEACKVDESVEGRKSVFRH
ncbi:coatomer subunit [Colletotrichum tofieldiae]|nr:coatomer subunit [Colletotrichum tofieldiae]GKT69575.1 coatomer subunit [Colletotrichum tofieldiae]